MTKKEIEKICKSEIIYPFLVICNKRSKDYTIQIYSIFDNTLYQKIQSIFNIKGFSSALSYSSSKNEKSIKYRRFDIKLIKRDIYE